MRSVREGQGQSGGRVGMQICWLYLHAFTGVCEAQCVSVCECVSWPCVLVLVVYPKIMRLTRPCHSLFGPRAQADAEGSQT